MPCTAVPSWHMYLKMILVCGPGEPTWYPHAASMASYSCLPTFGYKKATRQGTEAVNSGPSRSEDLLGSYPGALGLLPWTSRPTYPGPMGLPDLDF